jgi:protein-tyrosine phosphatase
MSYPYHKPGVAAPGPIQAQGTRRVGRVKSFSFRLTHQFHRAQHTDVKSSSPSVLFVCLGNICRSPLAEGICLDELEGRADADNVRVDSCGTSAWHAGEAPDPRSREVALRHGIDIDSQRSRRLETSDFHDFEWIVAMDRSNAAGCQERAPDNSRAKIVCFMDYVPASSIRDVPDPYYGGDNGFDTVFNLLRAGMGPLMDAVLSEPSGN